MRRLSLLFFTSCLLVSAAQSEQGSDNSQAGTDYRSRTIYFLLADRFHAHDPYQPYVDPEYPTATNPVNRFVTDCTEEQQWRSCWGGDIRGIIQKIDYLHHLGGSALWITPLMENVRDDQPGMGYGTGYHGYRVQNYYRVNAHFGSWDDVHQLSSLLHAHGSRYRQDITLNHSNPLDTHAYGQLFKSSWGDQVFINSYTEDEDPASGRRYYKHYNDDPRCRLVVNKFIDGAYEGDESQGGRQKLSGSERDNLLHDRVISFGERDTGQGTFMDNHNQMRTLVRLQKLGVTSETERGQRLDPATVLPLTGRGIPLLYYGDEQYRAYDNASNDDSSNRSGMKSGDESTPACKTIKIPADLRRSNTAVSRGSQRTIYGDNDILIYERRDGVKTVRVALNRGLEKTITLPG